MTQSQRLLAYLREHPGASSLEITLALGVVNVTGRVSDLRAAGHRVIAERDKRRVFRYRLEERPVQLSFL